jgi:hypothetical protein
MFNEWFQIGVASEWAPLDSNLSTVGQRYPHLLSLPSTHSSLQAHLWEVVRNAESQACPRPAGRMCIYTGPQETHSLETMPASFS